MQKITPCLWFNDNAEEAMNFYTSIFKDSKKLTTNYYTKEGAKVSGMPEGSLLTCSFELEGQKFMALNGGPIFKFTEAISLMVECKDQEEVDHFWDKLSEGGDKNAQQCGWLKDKFGVSWQIVPAAMYDLLNDPDKEKAERTMKAMLEMKKLDIAELQKAHDGK